MTAYIGFGMIFVVIVVFASWGYVQQYREIKRSQLKDRDVNDFVRRVIYSDSGGDDPTASFTEWHSEADQEAYKSLSDKSYR